MTDEAANEIIARWMGWTDLRIQQLNRDHPHDRNDWLHGTSPEGWRDAEVPDWTTSLDALAPALAKLTAEQWDRLTSNLLPLHMGKWETAQFFLTLKPSQIARAVAEVIQAIQQTK